jgi:hypothetical protein
MSLAIPKRAQEQSPSHARAKVQEKALAKRLGGYVTKGSGNKDEKGDVRLRKITRIEAKTTKNRSFGVSVDLIEKLEAACFGAGEVPMFEVELELGKTRFCVLPGYAMDMIVELLEARDEMR